LQSHIKATKRRQAGYKSNRKVIECICSLDINKKGKAEDIQEALKDLLGGTIQSMLEAEMDEHLGYAPYIPPMQLRV